MREKIFQELGNQWDKKKITNFIVSVNRYVIYILNLTPLKS